MDATLPATTAASVPPAYSGPRADQSKAAGGDFKSALAETSPDRDRGQMGAKQDAASNNEGSGASATGGTPVSAGRDADANKVQAAGQDAASTAQQPVAGSFMNDPSAPSGKDAYIALTKLVAALTQAANETVPADAAAMPADGSTTVKTEEQAKPKLDDQHALAMLSAVVQPSDQGSAGAVTAKPGTKTSVQDKTKSDKTEEDANASVTAKPETLQDTLSMLVQVSAPNAPVLADTASTAVTADKAGMLNVDGKPGNGIDLKEKPDHALKAPGTPAQTATAVPAAQTAHSSVADALHMVSGGGQLPAHEEKLTVADSASLANPGGLQGIDVLDTRRIIAPVNTNNGANIAAAMAGDGDWAKTMRSAATSDVATPDRLTTDKTLNTLSIKMTPENLGSVTANLKLVDGQLTVSLVVENGSAYRKLHEDQGELMKSLKAQGFGVDQIQISIASPDKSTNDANQNNSQSQTSNQQQAQQNNSGFGQGNSRQHAQPGFENFGKTSGGLVDDTTTSGGVGSANSSSAAGGQLYI